MVTNSKLVKEVNEKNTRNRHLEEVKLEEIFDTTKNKEEAEDKGK